MTRYEPRSRRVERASSAEVRYLEKFRRPFRRRFRERLRKASFDRVVFVRSRRRGDEVDDAADDFRRQRRNDVAILRLVTRDVAQRELRFGHDEKDRRLIQQELWHSRFVTPQIHFGGFFLADISSSLVIY